jgi:chromate reductase
MHSVAVFVGSLRRDSQNGKFAKALEKLGADRFAFTYPDLDLPLYNEDLWADPPPGVLKMKAEIAAASAVLFVTPEYNRSIPAVVKNAVDWGSRPWGENSWAGKPCAVAGVSAGQIGTALAQAHLRNILLSQDVILLGQPEIYFSKPGVIEDDGTIADESAQALLERFLDRFAEWIVRME